ASGALTTAPSLVWQAAHGWPQLRLGGVVAAEQATIGGRAVWLPHSASSPSAPRPPAPPPPPSPC
ncbi:hypothetical protein, partial [Nocardia abscessus]|uniref:hypothetical protein n=1 Tax=Nocardia abscessus TaxID=120957 RepID=UPI0024588D86